MSELSRLLLICNRIEEKVDALAEKQEEYLDDDEAARFLKIAKKTLHNKLSKGKIPASTYTTNVAGVRVFKKSKLIVDNANY